MADKKISELPILGYYGGQPQGDITASGVGLYPQNIVPVVVGGTTYQISLQNFTKYVTQYNATTGSNAFIGNQTIQGNVTATGDVTVQGKLTAQEVHTEITSASIIFESGSTIFGNSVDDTHQFTGIVSINGASINNQADRIHQATASLQQFTASQDQRNLVISEFTSSTDAQLRRVYQTTSSLNIFTGSQDSRNFIISEFTSSTDAHIVGVSTYTSSLEAQLRRVYQTTSSLNIFTGSQDSRNFVISQFTSSTDAHIVGIATYTSSLEAQLRRVYQTTSSLNIFTGSQDSRNFVISQFTASTDNHILGISAFTSSILAQNSGVASVTGSLNAFTASQLNVNLGNSIYTSSVNDTLARIYQTSASINIFTGSQDSRNFVISQFTSSTDAHIVGISAFTSSQLAVNLGNAIFTSSARIELNSIEAYTASLKNAITVSGTNVQIIGDLNVNKLNVQYVSSSVLVTSGSNTFGDQSTDKHEFTGSVYLQNSLLLGAEVLGNAGLNSFTASTNNSIVGVSAFTSSQLAVNLGNSIFTSSQLDVNLQNSIVTSSFRIELNSIEAYTASLKSQAIVSSSTQISNYYKFAETASANTFYGNQKVKGNLDIDNKVSITGSLIVSSSVNQLWATPEFQLYNGLGTVNFALTPNVGNQFTIQAYGTKAEILQANEPLRLLSPELQFVKYDNNPTLVSITGSVDVKSGGIKVRGNLDVDNKVSITGSLIVSSSANQLWATPDFELYNGLGNVNFRLTPNTGNQFQIQAYGTKAEITQLNEPLRLLSPTLQFVKYDNTATRVEISGSLNVSGSTIQFGNNTLIGNTQLSGSIEVSGSSNFKNSLFIVTGSAFFTGSHNVIGNSTFSGSINIASGSSYYRAGNKLFNYGQWASLETQSGSADTALAVKLGSTTNGSEGIYIANDGSGFPTRITAENTGLYNVQFSFQLNTTSTETCDFSVWYAMTGSNVANSNTDFSIDKTSGGGNGVAALNFLTHITANDYVQIYWSKSTANGQLVYKAPQGTPTRPATPSAIVTITQVA